MPIYDLFCDKCNKEIVDVLIKSYSSPLPKCECGEPTRKLISTPAFRFKEPGGTDKGRLMQVNPRKAKRT